MSPSRLTVEAWPITDPGSAGGANEDYVLVYQPPDEREAKLSGSLYIVADGSGGAERGALASQYAARQVAYLYYGDDEPDLGLRLRNAVEQANRDIYEYAQSRPELVKLTTTLSAAVIRGEQMHVASVGDSRVYLIRDGHIRQVTRDHTLVQQLIEEGAITPEEADEHPRRDVLLRTLGSEEEVNVDIYDVRLRPDDSVIVASAGLTRRIDDEELARVVATSSPRSAADSLVQRANLKEGDYDTTVIAALVRDGAPPSLTPVPYTWDRQPASFVQQQTLPGTPASGLPIPDIDEDATTVGRPTQAAPPRQEIGGQDEWTAPAPAYQQRQEQAPPRPPQQPQPAPPPQYQGEVDPVTGLPPVPGQQAPYQQQQPYAAPPQYGGGQQPYPQYGPRGYDPQQDANQRRGIPVGVFAAFGLVAVMLVIALVFLLLNPFGWNLPTLAGSTDPDLQATADAVATASAGAAAGGGDVATEPVVAGDDGGGEVATEPVVEGGGDTGGTDGGGDLPTATTAAPTEAPAPTENPSTPPGMVEIPGGAFTRGVTTEEVDAAVTTCIQETNGDPNNQCVRDFFEDADPVEEVTLSAYYIDEFEVTNAAYAQCVNAGICTPPSNRIFFDDPLYANHPVVYVNWNQAQTFCTGYLNKRLPTEAEWEKAARHDPAQLRSLVYPWGDQYVSGIANTLSANAGSTPGTRPVTDFEQDVSPYGVRGLGGNVTEWVFDWYLPDYTGLGTLDPQGPGNQPLTEPIKVARGGSFLELQSYSRSGHRFSINQNTQAEWLGFRCAAGINADVQTPETAPTSTPEGTPATEEDAAPTADPNAADGGGGDTAPTATPQP